MGDRARHDIRVRIARTPTWTTSDFVWAFSTTRRTHVVYLKEQNQFEGPSVLQFVHSDQEDVFPSKPPRIGRVHRISPKSTTSCSAPNAIQTQRSAIHRTSPLQTKHPILGLVRPDQAIPIETYRLELSSTSTSYSTSFLFRAQLGPDVHRSPLPLVNFMIINPKLHFSFQSISASAVRTELSCASNTKSITYQLPDFQRLSIPNFLFAAIRRRVRAESRRTRSPSPTSARHRSILVCFRTTDGCFGAATSNGNQGVLFRNCENWSNPLKPIVTFPTTNTATAVAMTPRCGQHRHGYTGRILSWQRRDETVHAARNQVLDSAVDQLFVNRELYYVKNNEDTCH